MKNIHLFSILLLSGLMQAQNTRFSSATIGTMEARQIGPAVMSGRITALEGFAKDPRILYVGTAGGGVWKTTTGGSDWKPVFDKHCQSIGALAIDPGNPDVVYAGTGESNMRNTVSIGNGVYKTTDGGENWTCIGLEKSEHIAKIVMDPKNSNTLYVAVPGPLWHNSRERGLYKTTDGGKTWTNIMSSLIDDSTGVAEVVVHPTRPEIVYAATWTFRRTPFSFRSGGKTGGLFKSEDGGNTWRKIQKGIPDGPIGRIALALAPSAPDNLIAIAELKNTALFISADGGESWKEQSSSSNVQARPFYFSTLVIDPKDPKRVYRPAMTFSISDDGGYSFKEFGYGGGTHPDHHALWINPEQTSQMFLGTDGGVYMSLDKGNNWLHFQNLPVSQLYHAKTDNAEPYNVYVGLQDNGSWYAPSQSPGGIENKDWTPVFGGDGFWCVPDRENPDIVYAEYQGGHIGRIDKRTFAYCDIQPKPAASQPNQKLRFNWNTPIATSPTRPQVIYTASQLLYRSRDKGKSWQIISPDLTTNNPSKQQQENSGGLTVDNSSAENHCTIYYIAESPLDSNLIWVGTDDGNLQYSADGGKNWTNVSSAYAGCGIPAQTWISSIEPSHADKNRVYVSFDNHTYGDMKTYFAVSEDLGKTWTRLNSSEFKGFANRIKEDHVQPNVLFAGTEMGLYCSIDRGKNWVLMKGNIPEYALVRDIEIQERTNDLVVATHGRGVLIVDDISPLRKLNEQILQTDLYLIPTPPVVVTNGKYGGAGGDYSSAGEYAGGNSSEEALITYYLKDRVSSGEVKAEIYDQAGNFIVSFPASKRKGINKIRWDMRVKAPRAVTGGTKMDGSGFAKPLVKPGTYKVVIIAGKFRTEGNIELISDRAGIHSAADKEVYYEQVYAIYNTINQLADINTALREIQDSLKTELTAGKGGKKNGQKLWDSLEVVRKTFVASKEGTAITGEEQLADKLAEIFWGVSGYEGRPTDAQIERIKGLQNELRSSKEKIQSLLKKAGRWGTNIPEVLRN